MIKEVEFFKTLTRYNSTALLIFLFSILFVLFHISLLGEAVYWWTTDGSAYIEAARNYSASGNLVISTGIDALNDTTPIRLWPPGYPILLSLIQDILGIDSQWVDVSISILSWMIVPSIIFALVRPLLGIIPSALLSILVLTSPAVVYTGYNGSTDMPFFLVVVLGFFLSCRLNSGWKATLSIFIGGLLLGVSFSLRSIGAAALMAVFVSYVITLIVRYDQRREVLLKIIVWGAGATMIVVPVFIRNIMTFGTLQPYTMAPSTVSLLDNIREYVRSTICDLFGSQEIAKLIAWDFMVFISVATIIMVISSYYFYRHSEAIIKRTHILLDEFKHLTPNIFVLITISIYSLLGMAIVIYARTKYEWGEFINLRHVMQYDWAILTILFFLLLRLIGAYRAKMIIYASCTLMIFGHIYYSSVEYYFKEPKFRERLILKYRIYNDDTIKEEVIRLSKQGGIIASNFQDVLKIKAGVPIRRLDLKGNEQLTQSIQEQLLTLKKRLLDKEGHIFIFLNKDTLDKVMEEKFTTPGVIVKQRNDFLVTFHLFPD